MEMIQDDPVIRCMEATGWPTYKQARMDDYPEEQDPDDFLDPIDKSVLRMIHYDKKHAITRQELVRKTGLSDREVRRCIERLRRTYVILNDQDGQGYYRSTETKEIYKAYRQEIARAMAILRRLKPMRRILLLWGYDV